MVRRAGGYRVRDAPRSGLRFKHAFAANEEWIALIKDLRKVRVQQNVFDIIDVEPIGAQTCDASCSRVQLRQIGEEKGNTRWFSDRTSAQQCSLARFMPRCEPRGTKNKPTLLNDDGHYRSNACETQLKAVLLLHSHSGARLLGPLRLLDRLGAS